MQKLDIHCSHEYCKTVEKVCDDEARIDFYFFSPNWVTIVYIFILKSSVTSIKHFESIWIVNSNKIYQLKLIYVLFVFVYRDDEQHSEIMLSLWNEFEEIKKEIPNRHSSTKNYLHSQCAVKCLYNCPIIILIPNFLLISYVFFFFSFFLFGWCFSLFGFHSQVDVYRSLCPILAR